MRFRSEDDVFAIYDLQTHRRFINTHTPLDGLPLRDDVHYVVVGRDPRDVMISWEHHMANMDIDVIVESRAEAIGLDDLGEYEEEIAASGALLDPAARFRQFTDAEWSPHRMVGLANVLHHLDTGWTHRRAPTSGCSTTSTTDVISSSRWCGSPMCARSTSAASVSPSSLPRPASTRMRERADEVVPDVSASAHFKDHARFFRSGSAGEWAD